MELLLRGDSKESECKSFKNCFNEVYKYEYNVEN